MELILDVRPLSPVAMDDVPAGARITLTDENIARIRRLAGRVRALGRAYGEVYGMELWDARPRWMAGTEADGPASECPMEGVTLCVTVDVFYWMGCQKHSDIWVETVPVLIRDLPLSEPHQPEATAEVTA